MAGPDLRFRVALLWLAAMPSHGAAPGSIVFTEAFRYEVSDSDRFPSGAALSLYAGGNVRPLVPGFDASADAAVSFDASRILFSGKRTPRDPWQIWEIALAGGPPRRITAFAEDTVTPFYLSSDRIVCARRTPSGYQLEVVSVEGKYSERLTFSPGDHLVCDVLRDGRVLFSATHAAGAGHDLYTVYADGSGVETYRCDHRGDRYTGVQLSSGDVLFPAGGKLARFTSARAGQVDLPMAGGEFAGRVAELSPEEWLVAFRPDGNQTFGLHIWRPGLAAPERVWSRPKVHSVEPVLVRPHIPPKRHPSALGDREGANLMSLNVYTSRLHIPAGSVATVRVWARDDSGLPIALGQAPVESDGSFYIRTPAECAIRLELLDRAGKVVAAEKGWFWARRGEQRICVGCHAGPERAPENASPAILRRSLEPTSMKFPLHTAAGGSR